MLLYSQLCRISGQTQYENSKHKLTAVYWPGIGGEVGVAVGGVGVGGLGGRKKEEKRSDGKGSDPGLEGLQADAVTTFSGRAGTVVHALLP